MLRNLWKERFKRLYGLYRKHIPNGSYGYYYNRFNFIVSCINQQEEVDEYDLKDIFTYWNVFREIYLNDKWCEDPLSKPSQWILYLQERKRYPRAKPPKRIRQAS